MKELLEEREALCLARLYPAAPDKVWRAWTEPDALRVWWNQARAPGWRAELDVRAGGRYRIVMRDPEGLYHDVRGAYREVVRNRRLAFTWRVHAAPAERESLVTVALRALGSGTELEFTQEPLFDAREHKAWLRALERLDILLRNI